jgi:hypothetical protein
MTNATISMVFLSIRSWVIFIFRYAFATSGDPPMNADVQG